MRKNQLSPAFEHSKNAFFLAVFFSKICNGHQPHTVINNPLLICQEATFSSTVTDNIPGNVLDVQHDSETY
jgi:hypothetical protein